MRSPLCPLAMLLLCHSLSIAQTGLPYGSSQDTTLPEWTQMMYSASPDPGAVMDAYNAYYKTHPFIQNTHTQYYKHWMRDISRALPPLAKTHRRNQSRSANADWTCIGPLDWDHGAVDKSYACGDAHVYTVEQAPSDPDILYAGTATSGVWRTEDRGISSLPGFTIVPLADGDSSRDQSPRSADSIRGADEQRVQDN